MVDVFISYSRNDQAIVAMLARAVEAEGYEVWWDAELPPHQSYGEVITDKIDRAKAAIVVWSATAVKSEWVRAEADMARHHRKLIQTAIDSALPPLPFNQIQYAEIGDWRGEAEHPGWRKVKASLTELCGRATPDGQSPRTIAMTPPPRAAPEAAAAQGRASRWPLFAGIGVGVIGLAVAGGALLGQRGSAPAPAAPQAAASNAPSAEALGVNAVPAVQVQAKAGNVAGPAPATSVSAAVAQAAIIGGEALPAPNPADLTFPDSSTRLLQPSEVFPLGPATLKVARNEIFARKGMRFVTPSLQQWFGRFAWYKPRFDKVQLNPIEQANVELIRQAEARYGE